MTYKSAAGLLVIAPLARGGRSAQLQELWVQRVHRLQRVQRMQHVQRVQRVQWAQRFRWLRWMLGALQVDMPSELISYRLVLRASARIRPLVREEGLLQMAPPQPQPSCFTHGSPLPPTLTLAAPTAQ